MRSGDPNLENYPSPRTGQSLVRPWSGLRTERQNSSSSSSGGVHTKEEPWSSRKSTSERVFVGGGGGSCEGGFRGDTMDYLFRGFRLQTQGDRPLRSCKPETLGPKP